MRRANAIVNACRAGWVALGLLATAAVHAGDASEWREIATLVEQGDAAAIVRLDAMWEKTEVPQRKQAIAVTLLSLGSSDARFYDYLERQALAVVERPTVAGRYASADLLALAQVGDPRSYELFLRGLQSPDPVVVGHSATGLGYIGDPRAIEPIRDATERLPAGTEVMIAVSLSYIDDPRAAELVATWVGSEEAAAEMTAQARRDREERRVLRLRFRGKH